MFVTQPPMYCMLCHKHLRCYQLCTVAIHFYVVETCVSKPKQLSLPVVLFPKKGANKYGRYTVYIGIMLIHSYFVYT